MFPSLYNPPFAVRVTGRRFVRTKMNPIGIAFGPGVADIRSRASQRIDRGGEKGGESGADIFFQNFDK